MNLEKLQSYNISNMVFNTFSDYKFLYQINGFILLNSASDKDLYIDLVFDEIKYLLSNIASTIFNNFKKKSYIRLNIFSNSLKKNVSDNIIHLQIICENINEIPSVIDVKNQEILDMHNASLSCKYFESENRYIYNLIFPKIKNGASCLEKCEDLSSDDLPKIHHEQESLKMETINNDAALLKVLMIDDEDSCLLALELLLFKSKYILKKSKNAEEAIAILQKNISNIDVIILDLMLPKMSGVTLLEKIKKDSKLKDIPVIIQSGTFDEYLIQKSFEVGAVSFIRKPYNKERILFLLNGIANKRKQYF